MVFTSPPPGLINPGENQARKNAGSKNIPPPSSDFMKINQDFGNLGRRMRIMEERYASLRHKTQVTDQNMLHNSQKFHTLIEVNNGEMRDIKREITDIKNKMTILLKELKLLAKKEDVEVLKKYVEMWEPVEFATTAQVERIVNEKIKEYMKK